ncbi:hypothetical protein E9993_08505 [Labilibacter sediminis]|nr:hypothetical protein E9993_08505 [Labilibacter sediminis]
MKFTAFTLGLILIFTSCNQTKHKKEQSVKNKSVVLNYNLQPVWSSDSVLKTPESVLYDEARDLIYVSNVNQNPWQKDGNGFISKLDLQGNIIELEWVTEMDGPKGMGLIDSILYVANIDEVVAINVNAGTIINRIAFENEDGLNDITIGNNGEVYVSSSSNSIIYHLINDQYEVLTKGEDERYNGLLYEDDRLLILTSKGHQLKSMVHDTRTVSVLVSDLGHGDGIVALPQGGYITSDWKGEIFYINSDYKAKSLLNTKDLKINTADIDFVNKDNLLLIPTFFDNRVVAYRLNKE